MVLDWTEPTHEVNNMASHLQYTEDQVRHEPADGRESNAWLMDGEEDGDFKGGRGALMSLGESVGCP